MNSSPGGIGCSSGTCSGAFAIGATVTLTVHPGAHASFGGWTGACSGSAVTCTVTMGADQQVGTTFVGPNTAGAHVVTVNVTGAGAVTSTPPGLSCTGSNCTTYFAGGTPVTLTFQEQGGSTFGGWTGDCTGTAACTLPLTGDQTVGAGFTTPANSHRITVVISGQGSVTSAPAGINCPSGACASFFADGSQVTLSATPAGGQTFSGWTGGGCSGAGDCTLTIGTDATTTATFAGPGY